MLIKDTQRPLEHHLYTTILDDFILHDSEMFGDRFVYMYIY